MSDSQISASEILKSGSKIGFQYYGPLLINIVLFTFTFWIPYINIGTFIGIVSGIPLKMSKGENISANEIFNSKYRTYFGEYFIMYGLKQIGISLAFLFLFIPSIILGLSWVLADLLFLDGKANFTECLQVSTKKMYNYKLPYFLAHLFFGFILILSFGIAIAINEYFGAFVIFLALFIISPIVLGIKAYTYKKLVLNN